MKTIIFEIILFGDIKNYETMTGEHIIDIDQHLGDYYQRQKQREREHYTNIVLKSKRSTMIFCEGDLSYMIGHRTSDTYRKIKGENKIK